MKRLATAGTESTSTIQASRSMAMMRSTATLSYKRATSTMTTGVIISLSSTSNLAATPLRQLLDALLAPIPMILTTSPLKVSLYLWTQSPVNPLPVLWKQLK